jgi:hypothetical protein
MQEKLTEMSEKHPDLIKKNSKPIELKSSTNIKHKKYDKAKHEADLNHIT